MFVELIINFEDIPFSKNIKNVPKYSTIFFHNFFFGRKVIFEIFSISKNNIICSKATYGICV
jgi:hypothetical protein